MERDNRKSHLAPQLSPSTQDLLRSRDSPPTQQPDERSLPTPTSGEIPIAGTGYVSSQGQQYSTSSRSPTRNSASSGRTGGPVPQRPGPTRGTTTNSIPQVAGYGDHPGMSPSPSQGNSFNLPMRPAPSGPLPPAPARRATPDDMRRTPRDDRETRRQPAYGLPPNPAYNV